MTQRGFVDLAGMNITCPQACENNKYILHIVHYLQCTSFLDAFLPQRETLKQKMIGPVDLWPASQKEPPRNLVPSHVWTAIDID